MPEIRAAADTDQEAILDIYTVISRIVSDNKISLHIHEQIGCRHIGVIKEAGIKSGRYIDVYLMQYLC